MDGASEHPVSELRYLSVFSGIGGLEHPTIPPLLVCEQDSACQIVLREKYPSVDVRGDITDLGDVPNADIVAGGWPCQDLSSAGTLGGIGAKRSGLFFDMLRVAQASGAHTLVGENVPNLLTINQGRDFQIVLDALLAAGFGFVGWRVLNARAFGLPQERRRLFIVASKDRARAASLHSRLPSLPPRQSSGVVSGFYWTGGKRSICFCSGYVPAIKIGATDNKGRAPVAILVGKRVRKLTPAECLRLQGFDGLPAVDLAPSTVLRMAANAVPTPMGRFVMTAVATRAPQTGVRRAFGVIGPCGLFDEGLAWALDHEPETLATNLIDFVDTDLEDSLSPQAAAGLIVRSVRSDNPMPKELFSVLNRLASDRTKKLKASRGNSFEALDSMSSAVAAYEGSLPSAAEYRTSPEEDEFELGSDPEEGDDE